MKGNHRPPYDLIAVLFTGLTALVAVVTLAAAADMIRLPALAPHAGGIPPTLFQLPTQPGPVSVLSAAQARAVAAVPTATLQPVPTATTASVPSGRNAESQPTGTASTVPPGDVLRQDSPTAPGSSSTPDDTTQAASESPPPLPPATTVPAQVRPVWPTAVNTGNTAVVSDVTPLPTVARDRDQSPPPPPGGRQIPLRVMVPTTGTVRQLQQRGVTSLTQLFPSMDPAESFSPGPRMPLRLPGPSSLRVPGAAPTSPFKTLAILVQFTDKSSQVSATFFDTLLFGMASQTVRGYYREVSYNQLDIVTVDLPSSLGWQTAPKPYANYVNGDNCTGGYPHNCQRLTEDLVGMVDPLVDFSQYDNNHDGWVDTVFIIHSGSGAEANGGASGLIWSHSWWTYNEPLVDGVRVGSYTTEPEYWFFPKDMTHGVYVHELGHAFGLPDLYDVDYSSSGIGDWSLMSGGSWNGILGNSPAHLDAWSRTYLEFNTVTDLTNLSGLISIPNVEQSQTGSIYRLESFRSGEYWLLENRQPIGSDSTLPGSGLLIWHVDENLPGDNRSECRQVNVYQCGTKHFRVALDQADGRRDLEYNRNGGDTGDPFPGLTNNTQFAFTSNPNNSSYYSSKKPAWEAHNISAAGSVINTLIVASALYPPTVRSPSDRVKTADRTPSFAWNAVTTATRYNLQVSTDPDFSSPALNVVTSHTSYTPSNPDALPYGMYYWRVAAGDQGGLWSDWSVVRAVTVSILGAPKNAAHVTDTTPAFTWSAVSSAVQYNLEVYDDAGLSHVVFAYTGLLSTVSPTSPLSSGQHWWRVQVDRGSGFEGWTPAWTLTVTLPPPQAPLLLSPAGGERLSTTTPQLTWGDVQGAYQYQVQIARSSSFSHPLQDVTLSPGDPLAYTASALADGGTYYWRVRALNGMGVTGTWSGARSFVLTQLAAPALLDPAGGIRTADQRPTFSWKPVAGADHYQIQFGAVSSFAIIELLDAASDTTYTPASALPDGGHFWRVRAVSPEGVGGRWSSTRSVIVDITGPPAPVLLSPANDSGTRDGTPTFSWKSASSAVRYDVRVLASDESTVLWENTTANTSITLPAASALSYGEYYWKVQAEDSVGNPGAWSALNRFTITIHLSPKDGTATTNPRPTFTWAAVAGAVQYEFELRSTADDSQVGHYTGTGMSYTPPAPLAEDGYTWRVRVDTGGGFGDWLPDWTLTITPPTPGKPQLLLPANQALTNATEPVFHWQAVTGGHTYQVQIDNNINFTSPERDVPVDVGLTSYTASSLPDGQYWWRVRALNSLGAPGAWSGKWSLTIDTIPPGVPALVAPVNAASTTNAKLVLMWGKVTDAARYELQLDLGSGFPLPGIDAQLRTSYKPPTPLSRERYYWRVRAIDQAGNASEWSETRNFVLVAGITAPQTTPEGEASGTPSSTPTLAPTGEAGVTATAVPTGFPTVIPTGTPLPGGLPYVESFDSGLGWQAAGEWQLDSETAYQGFGWFASGAARGLSSTLTAATDIDLRPSMQPELSFWQKADLSGSDQMAVDLSLDGGGSWLPLDQQVGAVFGWSPHTVDLAPYRGYVIRLRFRLDTLQPVPDGGTSLGWWIDELAVVEAPVVLPAPSPTMFQTDTLPPGEESPTATSTPADTPTPAGEQATATPAPTDTPADIPTVTPAPTASPTDIPTATPVPTEPSLVPTDTPTEASATPSDSDQ
ncbi:MAG TPA: M6 family metalloprotease domain-containing protein [Aggregatilineaceae bacterium]|nr:M6 family metalloprotease domain-containing protein [Aggregatilineaceae bacterium]